MAWLNTNRGWTVAEDVKKHDFQEEKIIGMYRCEPCPILAMFEINHRLPVDYLRTVWDHFPTSNTRHFSRHPQPWLRVTRNIRCQYPYLVRRSSQYLTHRSLHVVRSSSPSFSPPLCWLPLLQLHYTFPCFQSLPHTFILLSRRSISR